MEKKYIWIFFKSVYIYIIFLFLNAIGRVLSACNSRLDIANVFVLWILFVFCPTKYVGPSRHERSNWEGNPHGENLQPSRPPLIQSGTCMGCWKVRPFSQLKSSRSSQPAINSITVTLGYPHTHTHKIHGCQGAKRRDICLSIWIFLKFWFQSKSLPTKPKFHKNLPFAAHDSSLQASISHLSHLCHPCLHDLGHLDPVKGQHV